MRRLSWRHLGVFLLASVVLMGQRGCGFDISISDIITGHTAKITAVNTTDDLILKVILYADDAFIIGLLEPHTSTSIETHVEGQYTARFDADFLDADRFEANLQQLRSDTTRLFSEDSEEAAQALKSRIFHTKEELAGYGGIASWMCSGAVDFPETTDKDPEPVRIVVEAYRNYANCP